MRCPICKRRFVQGDRVLPLLIYVENATRGDFVPTGPVEYAHVSHLAEAARG